VPVLVVGVVLVVPGVVLVVLGVLLVDGLVLVLGVALVDGLVGLVLVPEVDDEEVVPVAEVEPVPDVWATAAKAAATSRLRNREKSFRCMGCSSRSWLESMAAGNARNRSRAAARWAWIKSPPSRRGY
jgi:hypothetical protein